MIEKPILKVGDTIKAEFENFLDQLIVVTGAVRCIEDPIKSIIGNDIESKQSYFVSLDEIVEINDVAVPRDILQSLKEVS